MHFEDCQAIPRFLDCELVAPPIELPNIAEVKRLFLKRACVQGAFTSADERLRISAPSCHRGQIRFEGISNRWFEPRHCGRFEYSDGLQLSLREPRPFSLLLLHVFQHGRG